MTNRTADEKRINDSVLRVLAAKVRVGLNKQKLVDLEEISDVIDSPEAEQQAQLAADRAVTLVKNEARLIPLANPAGACYWVLSESRYGMQGRRFIEEMRSRIPGARLQLLDPLISIEEMEQMLESAGSCEVTCDRRVRHCRCVSRKRSLAGSYPGLIEKTPGEGDADRVNLTGQSVSAHSFPNVAPIWPRSVRFLLRKPLRQRLCLARSTSAAVCLSASLVLRSTASRFYCPRNRGDRMVEITWLGHGTFQLTLESGEVIVLDPWTDGNPSYPQGHKFSRIDTIVISHGHFDHIHDAVPLAKQFKPQVVCIFETCHWLESKGVENVSAMNKGGSQKAGPLNVTMTHAVHSCGILDDGKIIYGGEAAGYVLRVR